MDQAADILVHREATLGRRAVAVVARPVDEEFLRAVDDGFHPQDHAELVVHFQPIARHAMLEACAEQTIGLDFRLHVAVKAAIPLAAEEPQDVLGGERHGRKLEELLVEPGQGGRILEEQVGGELGLIDHPANPVTRQVLA